MRARYRARQNNTGNRLQMLRQQRRRILQRLEACSHGFENDTHGQGITSSNILKEQEQAKDWEQAFYSITSEISELECVMKSKKKH